MVYTGPPRAGGTTNNGTIFEIAPGGALSTLYSFCPNGGGLHAWTAMPDRLPWFKPQMETARCNLKDRAAAVADGIHPARRGSTVEVTVGRRREPRLRVIAVSAIYSLVRAEAVERRQRAVRGDFENRPASALATLYGSCAQGGCADGYGPQAALIQATDGGFYGTTAGGGANAEGTAFKITSSGALATVYSFCAQSGCADGATPLAALVQDTNGEFYGTTLSGGTGKVDGSSGCGTVSSLSVGLGPFVETLPAFAAVGAEVRILGPDLTVATSASFNGTAAAFEVVSSSEITTTVPAGPSSGKLQVVTPSGTLSSNVSFQVLP